MRAGRVSGGAGKLAQRVTLGPHGLIADEPVESGGDDTGPAPHDFLLAALGSCTAITLRIYAARKGWPLENVDVALEQQKVEGGHEIRRTIRLDGPLDDEQRRRLLEIAEKCPVHKTLTGEIRIASKLG
jgi:putative redox protein